MSIALKAYYQEKVTVCMDALDELERLQREPGIPQVVKQNAEEVQIPWQRAFSLAQAEYDGVRLGISSLPLPPDPMRKKLSDLSDKVERQINANKAAAAGVEAATKFLAMVEEFNSLA